MASSEGIRSPFSTQVSTRSPKLRIYASLFLFNQGVDHLVTLLRSMEKFSFADKEELQPFQATLEVYTHACGSAQRDAVNMLADQLFPNVPKLDGSGNAAQEEPQVIQ